MENENNNIPLVNQESSFVTQNINMVPTNNVNPTFNNQPVQNDIQTKPKNPNLVLYIVLAVVATVAIVCVTLVIVQARK